MGLKVNSIQVDQNFDFGNVSLGGKDNTITRDSLNSTILAGQNNTIGTSSTNSVILGGSGLELDNESNVIYVPSLKISTVSNINADRILVWNTDNYVGYRDVSTIGGGGGSSALTLNEIAFGSGPGLTSSPSLSFNKVTSELELGNILVNDEIRFPLIGITGSVWEPLSVGLNQDLYGRGQVYAVTTDLDGNIIAGGVFTNTSDESVTGLNNIAKFNVTTSTWSPLGVGLNGIVYALTIDLDGNIIAGGDFTYTYDESVQLNNIAKFNVTTSTWEPLDVGLNNAVWALTKDLDGNTIAGGDFSQTSDGSVTNLNKIGKFNVTTSTWEPLGVGLNATVYALTTDLDGNIIAGGFLTQTFDGSVTNLNYIAKFSTKSTWEPLGVGLNEQVITLTTDLDGNIIAGGVFTQTSDGLVTGLNYIAKFNVTSSIWSSLDVGLSNIVRSLTLDLDGNIIAGGDFTQTSDGSVELYFIAKFNKTTSTWEPLSVVGLNDSIYSLTTDLVGNIIAGGIFTQTRDKVAINRIALIQQFETRNLIKQNLLTKQIDIYGGVTLTKENTINNSTNEILLRDNTSGLINSSDSFNYKESLNQVGLTNILINNEIRFPLISVTGSTWEPLSVGLDSYVYALTIDLDGNIITGGQFTQTSDGSVTGLNCVAKFNVTTSTWSPLGVGLENAVFALTTDLDGNIIAGGYFSQTSDHSVTGLNNISKFNVTTSTWETLSVGLDGQVYALTIDLDGNIIAGGVFAQTSDHSVELNNIAKFNVTTSTWEPLSVGLNGYVYSLTIDLDGNIIAGGTFTQTSDNSVELNKIAKFNVTTSTWEPLDVGLNNVVNALTIDLDGNIIAGGAFTQTSDGSVTGLNNIAKFNVTTSTWGILGGEAEGLNTDVYALTIDLDGNIIAGGAFTQTSDGSVTGLNYIVKFNVTTSTWEPLDVGFSDIVKTLTYLDGNIISGGNFTRTSDSSVQLNYIGQIKQYDQNLINQNPLTNELTVVGSNSFAVPSLKIGTASVDNSLDMILVRDVDGYVKSREVSTISGGGGPNINKEITSLSYTMILADVGSTLIMNNSSAQTIIIDTYANVAFSAGTKIDIIQIGSGTVSFSAEPGVTLNSKNSYTRIANQYSGTTLLNISSNNWVLIGNLTS